MPVITASQAAPPDRDALVAADLGAGRPARGRSGATVTDISVSTANLVTLKLGKVTVVWGGASEPQLKVEVMTVLLGQKGVADSST